MSELSGSEARAESATPNRIIKAGSSWTFPEDPKKQGNLLLGGKTFSKEAITRTLEGEGRFQPAHRQDGGLVVPLVDSATGNIFSLVLEKDSLLALKTRLGIDKSEPAVNELLKREIMVLVNEPKAQVELERTEDGNHGRRYIGVPNFVFQGRTYGRAEQAVEGKEHRVYFQVEKEDIPEVVRILKEIGVNRAARGGGLDFKFLVAKTSEDQDEIEMGVYKDLKDEDPRVVLFFESAQRRKEFFEELWRNRKYLEALRRMSAKRMNPDGSYKARRPGTHTAYDPETGKELRALNYGEGGYSEDVVEEYGEKEWRKVRRGTPTGHLGA